MIVHRCLAASFGVAGLVACAPSPTQRELRTLGDRLQALQEQTSRFETQIADLQNQVFLLNDHVSQVRADAEVTRPPPRLQVVRLEPPAAESRRGVETDAVDIVLTGDEEPGRLPLAAVPPPPPGRAAVKGEADALFRDALTAFREGRAERASELFLRFVERFPAHANTDKALFWVGESRLEAGAYALAVEDFRQLLLRHPRSSKVPDALFKMGLAYEKLGKTSAARQAFSDLVTNYPATALSELARPRLAASVGGGR